MRTDELELNQLERSKIESVNGTAVRWIRGAERDGTVRERTEKKEKVNLKARKRETYDLFLSQVLNQPLTYISTNCIAGSAGSVNGRGS